MALLDRPLVALEAIITNAKSNRFRKVSFAIRNITASKGRSESVPLPTVKYGRFVP